MSAPGTALRLLSLNVNGLHSLRDKRRTLFHCLQDSNWDVVALQETHHGNEAEGATWAKEGAGPGKAWAGPAFWAHGAHNPTASAGVAVLVRDGARVADVQLRHQDPNGRLLAIDFTHDGHPFTVVSVYAPVAPASREGFFTASLLPALPSDRQLLVGGDFNCVADASDVVGGDAARVARRQLGYAGGLQTVEAERSLRDAWRALRPLTVGGFTHTSSAGTAARLDRWLVSDSLVDGLRAASTGVEVGLPGDHLGVSLGVVVPNPTLVGKGPWRLAPHWLEDETFKARINSAVPAFLAANPPTAALSRGARWDALKQLIRSVSTQYVLGVAQARRRRKRHLEEEARRAMAAFSAAPANTAALQFWLGARARLQGHWDREARDAALRAQVLWQHWGEQGTFWFHRVTRERQARTAIANLLCPPLAEPVPLVTPAARDLGLGALRSFFSGDAPGGLYAPRPVHVPAQDSLLAAVDQQLDGPAAAACLGQQASGSISLEEAGAALKGLPRGKAPGPDGLPFEFWVEFWPLLGAELVAVLEEAFQGSESALLPSSMRTGRITLLHKGKGGDRAAPASYRPITLLNTDYKLLARVITRRLAEPLASVIDPTQTAFLPGRWIGENVLAHLEEVDYLLAAREPGVQVFLDLEKAYDRLDRGWLMRCLAALGLPPAAMRWVRLLHGGTQATVAMNGWATQVFPVNSGVFQGSPLSPLLYVAACQPMAAMARQQAAASVFRPILLPSGLPAPVMHQHADDTSIHVRSREDAARVLAGPIRLHCEASAARLQPSKTTAWEVVAEDGGPRFTGPCPLTGMQYVSGAEPIRHLGVLIGSDAARCAREMFDAILTRLEARVRRWAGHQLSFLGRAYVAKQCMASMVYYHAAFVRPPRATLQRIAQVLNTYVAGNRLASAPGAGGGSSGRLHPCREVCALPWEEGGIALADVELQVTALQACNVSRLLQPGDLAWKAYARQWFGRSAEWLASHPHVPPRAVDCAPHQGLVIAVLAAPLAAGDVPQRVRGYAEAFRKLRPHRQEGGPAGVAAGDAGAWAVGSAPVTALVVKAVNLRLQRLRRLDTGEVAPLQPLRPKVWPSDVGPHPLGAVPAPGLHTLEARWALSRADRLAPAFSPPPPEGLADAPWMHPAPARPSPAQRQLARQQRQLQQAGGQGVGRGAAGCGRGGGAGRGGAGWAAATPCVPAADVLALPPHLPKPPWVRVWRDLRDASIDRQQRALGWRILHGALAVGAFNCHVARVGPEAAGCPHVGCQGALQDLTHAFLTCPVAAPVWAWIAEVWGHLSESLPPVTPAIILAADPRPWAPAPHLADLWSRLRLTVLQELWRVARPSPTGSPAVSATLVAARVVYSCRRAMVRDWALVQGDVRARAGVAADWLRGRDPRLPLEAFRARWCQGGALCTAAAGAAEPCMRWTLQSPVPVPA